jgi:hypothetical protein
MVAIKDSGLYEASSEIRCCVVNDGAEVIADERFNDGKISVTFLGPSTLFERATILHMRQAALQEQCAYWYVHTKGITHYGSVIEANVNDWVQLLLYWNVWKWRFAHDALCSNEFDVYGCNYQESPVPHFSGNFWWSTSKYVSTLPDFLDPVLLCAAEFWLCTNKPRVYNTLHSGVHHYTTRYPTVEIETFASLQHRVWVARRLHVAFMYGTRLRCIDVTAEATEAFQSDTNAPRFHIAANADFNQLFGDVLPHQEKRLYVLARGVTLELPESRACGYEIDATEDTVKLCNKTAGSEYKIACGEITLLQGAAMYSITRQDECIEVCIEKAAV